MPNNIKRYVLCNLSREEYAELKALAAKQQVTLRELVTVTLREKLTTVPRERE